MRTGIRGLFRRARISFVATAALGVALAARAAEPLDWVDLGSDAGPSARTGAAWAYHLGSGKMVLFGGVTDQTQIGHPLDDTWVWDGSAWTAIEPAHKPPARTAASFAADPVTGNLILFGGVGELISTLGDAWAWDGSDWTQLAPAHTPSPRSGAAMVLDDVNDAIVLFGGAVDGFPSYSAETWTWNGTDWTQRSPAHVPAARGSAALAFDAARGEAVLFGGTDGSLAFFSDTWTWNGTDWTVEAPATSPPGRLGAMTYDVNLAKVVLQGGFTGTTATDTWTWDGTTWAQLVTAHLPRRPNPLGYHPGSGRVVFFCTLQSNNPVLGLFALAPIHLDPVPGYVPVGSELTLHGAGVTPGSLLKVYVATAQGAVDVIPGGLAPTAVTSSSWTGTLPFPWPVSAPNDELLGNGFAAVQLVRADAGYDATNLAGVALVGDPALHVPSVLALGGTALSASGTDLSIAVANVESLVAVPGTLGIDGDGFENPVVNVFTAAGNVGPLAPTSASANHIDVSIPGGTPIGPGSVQVVNGTNTRASNAVSVPIGEAISVTSVGLVASTVTVNGTGFNDLTVLNVFASVAGNLVNVGGLSGGAPSIPLSIVDAHQLTFALPAGLDSGKAYVQAINPPFIPFTSSGSGPGGDFTLP